MAASPGPILTLEPLIAAVRHGVSGEGWELSGLQKTTSHQFEGRWEGDSTRSAYLFFHPTDGPDHVSIDVYLDETSRGLTGNLALVVDLAPFGSLGNARGVLASLGEASARELDRRHKRPVTLRLRLSDAAEAVEHADTEIRFKIRIPRKAMGAGHATVSMFSKEAVHGFTRLLDAPEVVRLLRDQDAES
ncbi:MAG: hypothetical protein HKN72_10145 [Gemmatimonadetes bacterium]|nr:hypothetical protein [Gemmatimonadota bacterium]NNF13577.1 hypothetical protein [Gemmatimonadota bacterium]NNL29796.1 hypothetical protein [Gemmatimonadota bacterium]